MKLSLKEHHHRVERYFPGTHGVTKWSERGVGKAWQSSSLDKWVLSIKVRNLVKTSILVEKDNFSIQYIVFVGSVSQNPTNCRNTLSSHELLLIYRYEDLQLGIQN